MSKITIDRAVVERVLDALCNTESVTGEQCEVEYHAIRALRAALEQPQVEQEPMRVFFPRHTPQHGEDWAIDPAFLSRVLHSIDPDTPCDFTPSPEQIESTLLALEVIPSSIYTHPQPPRQPLTDEQLNCLWRQTLGEPHAPRKSAFDFARAIERAHGIGDEK